MLTSLEEKGSCKVKLFLQEQGQVTLTGSLGVLHFVPNGGFTSVEVACCAE